MRIQGVVYQQPQHKHRGVWGSKPIAYETRIEKADARILRPGLRLELKLLKERLKYPLCLQKYIESHTQIQRTKVQ